MIRRMGLAVICMAGAGTAPAAIGQDLSLQLNRFLGVISLPALVIADRNENGVWPDLTGVNELLGEASGDIELCAFSVDQPDTDNVEIGYSFADAEEGDCTRSFLASAQRSSEDDQCFRYSVSADGDSTELGANGRVSVADVCGSDPPTVRFDISEYGRQSAGDQAAEAVRQRLRERLSEMED